MSILFSKKVLSLYCLLILLFCFFCFKTPLESLLESTLVQTILGHVYSEWYNDVFFFILTFTIVLITFFNNRFSKPDIRLVVFLCCTTIIYLFYRFQVSLSTSTSFEFWEITPLSFFSWLKYADLLIILTTCQLYLFFREFGEVEFTPNSKSFLEDKSLGKNGVDELGYEDYANDLAKRILSSRFSESFAIGINGKWGMGKTSFMDLLSRTLRSDGIKPICFEPWRSNGLDSIINDFFELVGDEKSMDNFSLKKSLKTYSSKLIDSTDNWFTAILSYLRVLVIGTDSTSDLYSEVKGLFERLDKTTVIFIDDIDRLEKSEVIEVLKLVRNLANFPNVCFVLGYDKDYVVSALRNHSMYNAESYLEKIVQLEISLPLIDESELKRIFDLAIKKKLGLIENEKYAELSLFHPWLNNVRTINQYVNGLEINYSRLKGLVELDDFAKIELLRLKFPSVHSLLCKEKTKFLQLKGDTGQKNYYTLRIFEDVERVTLNEEDKMIKSHLEFFLRKHPESVSVLPEYIDELLEFIESVFSPVIGHMNQYFRNNLSIVYPSKFERYFAYKLFKGRLSELEFSIARGKPKSYFKNRISEWVSEGLEGEVMKEFYEIDEFDDSKDFENVISGIFHFMGLKSQDELSTAFSTYMYDLNNLSNKLHNYGGHFVDKYYGGKIEDYKDFLSNLFKNATFPYRESNFIANQLRQSPDSNFLPLTYYELLDFNIAFLEKYANSTKEFDEVLMRLYDNSRVINGEDLIVHDRAKQIIRKFAVGTDPKGFTSIVIQGNLRNDTHFGVNSFLLELFDTYANFEKAFLNIPENITDEKIVEFGQFYNRLKGNDFKAVEFEFRYTKLNSI